MHTVPHRVPSMPPNQHHQRDTTGTTLLILQNNRTTPANRRSLKLRINTDECTKWYGRHQFSSVQFSSVQFSYFSSIIIFKVQFSSDHYILEHYCNDLQWLRSYSRDTTICFVFYILMISPLITWVAGCLNYPNHAPIYYPAQHGSDSVQPHSNHRRHVC